VALRYSSYSNEIPPESEWTCDCEAIMGALTSPMLQLGCKVDQRYFALNVRAPDTRIKNLIQIQVTFSSSRVQLPKCIRFLHESSA
jgi:hypothetical protein